ncbi:MAG TPA: MFS transporter [Spirochaetia bacterium]|nr:MFS transporter [Spirochaetia bacterium]
MDDKKVTLYGYRWLVLGVFALINLVVQAQWLTFAPVATIAQGAYHATPLQIDMLSIIFMLAFIVFSIPASYIIDTFGLRVGVGIAAVLVGVFGTLKGLFADNYTIVFISQTGLAIAQPLATNAISKLSVHWFPKNERATASGIASLAMYIGIALAMVLTPILVNSIGGGTQLRGTLLIYGLVSLVAALLVLVFMRDRPKSPPVPGESEERFRVAEGLKYIFAQRSMIFIIILGFVLLGMFNSINTVIDQVGSMKGLSSDQSGLIGGVMLIAGIIGAVVLPIFSDRQGRRRAYIILAIIGIFPGLLGLALLQSFVPVLISAFVLGFFMLGAAPIVFQYSAEITYPAPESSSQGMFLLAGNVSGAIFILGIDGIGVNPLMILFLVLAAICIVLSLKLKESSAILPDPADN